MHRVLRDLTPSNLVPLQALNTSCAVPTFEHFMQTLHTQFQGAQNLATDWRFSPGSNAAYKCNPEVYCCRALA